MGFVPQFHRCHSIHILTSHAKYDTLQLSHIIQGISVLKSSPSYENYSQEEWSMNH